jgi:hypothetical protein
MSAESEIARLKTEIAALRDGLINERSSALTDAADAADELIGYFPDVTGRKATAADVVQFIRAMARPL